MAELVLQSIDTQLDEYYDSCGFDDNTKDGREYKDKFLTELKIKFDKLSSITLTQKQQERKSKLYKYYRTLNK